MREKFRRIVNSSRARFAVLLSVATLGLGSCGGLMLSNYTVAGMNSYYATHARVAFEPREPRRAWYEDANFPLPATRQGYIEARADTSDGFQTASY